MCAPAAAGALEHGAGGSSLSFCPACETFRVEFGMAHLRLSSAGLIELLRVVDELVGESRRLGFPARKLRVEFDGSPVTLALWPGELLPLRKLLRGGLQIAMTGGGSEATSHWTN